MNTNLKLVVNNTHNRRENVNIEMPINNEDSAHPVERGRERLVAFVGLAWGIITKFSPYLRYLGKVPSMVLSVGVNFYSLFWRGIYSLFGWALIIVFLFCSFSFLKHFVFHIF